MEVADLGMKILGACVQTQLNSCRPRHPHRAGHSRVMFPGVLGEDTWRVWGGGEGSEERLIRTITNSQGARARQTASGQKLEFVHYGSRFTAVLRRRHRIRVEQSTSQDTSQGPCLVWSTDHRL